MRIRVSYILLSCIGMIPVSVNKNTPPEKKPWGTISFQNTKSGAGEQFTLLGFRAKAHLKGVFCFQDIGMIKSG